MIEVTNEIFDNDVFGEALKKIYDKDDLDAVTTYLIAEVFQKVGDKSFAFFQAKAKLLQQYGEIDPEDKEQRRWRVAKEKAETFLKELKALHAIKIKFEVEPLVYKENFQLSGRQINALRPFLNLEEVKAEIT